MQNGANLHQKFLFGRQLASDAMSLRLGQFLLLFLHLLQAMAMVEAFSAFNYVNWENMVGYGLKESPPSEGNTNCNGKVGECIDESEEMMMDSEASQHTLSTGQKFDGYRAYQKDHVPCNQPGKSYYSCMKESNKFSQRRFNRNGTSTLFKQEHFLGEATNTIIVYKCKKEKILRAKASSSEQIS
ncbi:Rapid ALkalinization Factor [Cynara cardunculus var. scolymus]|uniref:Rapid ALkalinization Factor n=1 Tax=Cynara cardunculus var. scolymus TaxID=59895 RepID=A0A103XTX4_CYNCS|nr:Rapid ALkalinization Factor [Cynara cardunculus var. scolymus]